MKAVVLVLVLLSSLLATAAITQLDPIRKYLGPNGTIVLHGHVDQVLLDYLEHGPRAADPPRFVAVRSSYPTLALVFDSDWNTALSSISGELRPGAIASSSYSSRNVTFASFIQEGQRAFGVLEDQLRGALAWILFGWWTGDASATCGAGNGSCFWIAGTGSFSSTSHWSASSGGASCTCTPASTDTVTFDASSGAGTATQDVATFTSKAVTMTSSSVTIAGSSNTWNVGGNWSDANGHFSSSNETVVFTASATIVSAIAVPYVKNLTVNASVTLTLGSDLGQIGGTLTIANTAVVTGTAYRLIISGNLVDNNVAPGGVSNANVEWSNNNNIPGDTYYSFCESSTAAVVFNGLIGTNGNSPVGGACAGASFGIRTNGQTVTTNGLQLTVSGSNGLVFRNAGASPTGLLTGSSAVTVTSVNVAVAVAYITSTSSGSWTVSGSWTNASTSASWSFFAPILFNSTTNQSFDFNGTAGQDLMSGNVTFNPAAGTPTYTLAAHPLLSLAQATVNTRVVSDTLGHAGPLGGDFQMYGQNAGLVLGGSADVSGLLVVYFGVYTTSIPGGTYGALWLFQDGSPTQPLKLGGNISVVNYFGAAGSCTGDLPSITIDAPSYIVTNGYSITTTYDLEVKGAYDAGLVNSVLIAGSSSVSIRGFCGTVYTPVTDPNNGTEYVTTAASGSWTVPGIWSNASLSSSWSFAAPITFTGTSQTITSAAGAPVSEFNTVTIPSGANVAADQYMTFAQLDVRGNLTLPTDATVVVTGIKFWVSGGWLGLKAVTSFVAPTNLNVLIDLVSSQNAPLSVRVYGVLSSVGVYLNGNWTADFRSDGNDAVISGVFIAGENWVRIGPPGQIVREPVPVITCTASEIGPFAVRLYCTSSLTPFPAASASHLWYVNGIFVVRGPLLDTVIPDVLMNQSATVSLQYGVGLVATKTVALDDRANPAVWALVVALAFLGRTIYRGRRTPETARRDKILAARRKRAARGDAHIQELVEQERERRRRRRMARERRRPG